MFSPKTSLFKSITAATLTFSFASGVVIYSTDFSSNPLPNSSNVNIGGNGGNQGILNGITAASNVTYSTGSITTTSFNGQRGLFIALEIQDAGDHTLSFNVSSVSNFDATNFGTVTIYSGIGIEDNRNSSTNNGISVNADNGTLTANGSTSLSTITTSTFNSAGTVDLNFASVDDSVTFIFLGVESSGNFPFPEAQFDNITVSSLPTSGSSTSVPEPSSIALLGIGVVAFIFKRRK